MEGRSEESRPVLPQRAWRRWVRNITYALCGIYVLLCILAAVQVSGPVPETTGQDVVEGVANVFVHGLVQGFAVIFAILMAVTVIPAFLMARWGGRLAIPGLLWAFLPFAIWFGLSLG